MGTISQASATSSCTNWPLPASTCGACQFPPSATVSRLISHSTARTPRLKRSSSWPMWRANQALPGNLASFIGGRLLPFLLRSQQRFDLCDEILRLFVYLSTECCGSQSATGQRIHRPELFLHLLHHQAQARHTGFGPFLLPHGITKHT